MQQYVERVVDLIEPEANQIYNLPVEEARRLLLEQPPNAMGGVDGSLH